MKHIKVITVCFMALSIIAQAVNAVSAPCPMLHAAAVTPSINDTQHMMMDMPNHDMSKMEHTLNGATQDANIENCCSDESCPMNSSVTGFIFSQPLLSHSDSISLMESSERVPLTLSLSIASLYRPPIFA